MKEFKDGDKVHDVLTLKNGVIVAYCHGYANIKFNDGIVNYPKEIMSLINHGHLDHENFTYEPVCKVKATPKPKPKKYHVEFTNNHHNIRPELEPYKSRDKYESIEEFAQRYNKPESATTVQYNSVNFNGEPTIETWWFHNDAAGALTSVKLIKD